jgi:hypothetical protein
MHMQLLQVFLLNLKQMLLFGQVFNEFFANGLLMVAEDSNLLVGLIILFNFLIERKIR